MKCYLTSRNYRTYNSSIVQDFLQDRPHKAILHCIERRQKSRKFGPGDCQTIDNEKGVFVVKGSCKDWIRFKFPCKHFFAIFNHCPNWSWNSLPNSYLNSEYLSQDKKALDLLDGPQPNSLATHLFCKSEDSREEADLSAALPTSEVSDTQIICTCVYIIHYVEKSRPHQVRRQVTVTLKVIESLAYTCDSFEDLSYLLECAQKLSTDFKSCLPSSNGPILGPASSTESAMNKTKVPQH